MIARCASSSELLVIVLIVDSRAFASIVAKDRQLHGPDSIAMDPVLSDVLPDSFQDEVDTAIGVGENSLAGSSDTPMASPFTSGSGDGDEQTSSRAPSPTPSHH